uniref:MABP domain-containing protein n=1 Tax=Nothobranchius furzeri TaxID=105023 RepID=A0A8C6LSQ7_NOTFU
MFNVLFSLYLQISFTEDGATANFVRGFAIKSGYYLCYSKVALRGTQTSVSKKKRVCARYSPVSSVDTAVLDIKLTSKSKMMLQHYTYVGDVNGYVLWCRKGQFTNTFPQPKPRNVGLDMRKLSLDQPDTPPALPLRHRWNAQTTSTGSFRSGGAAVLLRVPPESRPPYGGNSFRPLVSAISFFRSLPKAHDHR